jgi:hypothetical protein
VLPRGDRFVQGHGPLYIGRDMWHACTMLAINRFSIFNRALPSAEILALAANTPAEEAPESARPPDDDDHDGAEATQATCTATADPLPLTAGAWQGGASEMPAPPPEPAPAVAAQEPLSEPLPGKPSAAVSSPRQPSKPTIRERMRRPRRRARPRRTRSRLR